MDSGHVIGPAAKERSWENRKNFTLLMGMTLVFCFLAASKGPDANWDLLNYHQYNPFALLNKPFGFDLIPAQLQSFLNPTLDLPYYFFRLHLNNWPRLLNAIMALPQALAAFLAYRIALETIPEAARGRETLALIAVAFGATGVASLPTLGTSQSEMIPASFLLGGLLLLLRSLTARRVSFTRMAGAGALCGIAFGLKLTLLPYCLALGVAVTFTCGSLFRGRIISIGSFAFGMSVGALVSAGPWWLRLYSAYGNPLFPYFNDIFQSPFYDAVRLSDERFKPADLLHAIFYPFFWATERQSLIAELPFRDPRLALAYVAIIVTATGALLAGKNRLKSGPWLDARGWFFLTFISVGFVVWEVQFSILRYLAPLELVSGISLLLAMRPLLAARIGWFLPHAAFAGLTVLSLSVTVYPEWGHAPHGPVSARVSLPEFGPDSLVILLDSTPMSFIAAFAPATVRFVGANNNLVRPGLKVRLNEKIEQVIRNHKGPIWGLEQAPGEANVGLAYFSLHRGEGCLAVQTNLNNNSVKICRLFRDNN